MATRRKRHVPHEEPAKHERWLITYADMITLLMVLFIVLFSMSQVDLAKYEKLKTSLNGAFGASGSPVLEGGEGVLESGTSAIELPGSAVEAQEALRDQQAAEAAAEAEQAALEAARVQLAGQLEAAGLAGGVHLAVERRGLVVSIASDRVLFDPGAATLRPEGSEVIAKLSTTLAALPNPLVVEGHTDDVPISGFFPSNWELSTARATTVLQALVGAGVRPQRLSATGYADQRPVASNSTTEGRARNRRVAILVKADATQGGN